MMNCFPLGLLVLSLLNYVVPLVGSLLGPVDVKVDSVNFHHVLRWTPAPGTPPGTVYRVYKRSRGRMEKWKSVRNTTTTSANLKLKYNRQYSLSVEAYDNQTRSPMAGISFYPYSDTKIGPPELSLACCGNCIQMNMSLVEPNSTAGIHGIHKIYDVKFRVRWRREETEVNYRDTRNKNLTLDNLQEGVKYCVQVHPMISVNRHTESSLWECIFTSPAERRDPVVGIVTAVLIIALGALTTSMFFLHYTGFLCKVATLPRAMIMALSQGYTLTPEGTSPDPVSITLEKDEPRNHNSLISPPVIGDRDEDEEEEEEDGVNNYMDRNAQFSSGESLCCNSDNMQETCKPDAQGDCGSFTDRLSSEVEVPDAPYQGGLSHGSRDDSETNLKVSTVPEGGQTEFKEPVTGKEEEMEEVFDSSCGVNLFSVTLAALGGGEEEGEEHDTRNSLIPLLGLCDVEPELVPVPQPNSQTVNQSTDDVAYRCASYIRTYGIQHEEEEEDDRCFDGYMAHT